MSQEKVEIVRRIYDEWAVGRFQAGIDDFDQHVVFVVRPDFPEWGVFNGPDGVRHFMESFLEQWELLTIEAKRIEAVGFRGKKIVRLENAMDEREALEAVGLSE
jgi:ketosteroid isomerase-like protein